MKEQFEAILGVIIHPKQTMQALPADRIFLLAFLSPPADQIFLLAFLSPLYFGISRAFRPRNHEVLLNALGGNWQIVLAIGLLALVMIPVGAWLMRQFLKLFKKRLSVRKLMNINGYAHVPRLVVALVGYLIMFMNPTMFASERPTPGLIAIIVLYFAGSIYTLFLYVYGVVVCPSEDKNVANQASEATSDFSLRDLPLLKRPFSFRGRASRLVFWFVVPPIWVLFVVLWAALEIALEAQGISVGFLVVFALHLPLTWIHWAVLVQRLHDRNKQGAWAMLLFIPIGGPLWALIELGCMPGSEGPNRYGRA